jgi:hypothetical protein
VSDSPLVAGPLYGLRSWTVASGEGPELLAGPHRGTPWPPGGGWLEAGCPHGHAAPAADCECGIHAWHPRPDSARRVLASRREIPGIVEADGAVEVHEEGFRAERARPHALVSLPGRNARLIERLAAAYGAEVLQLRRPEELLAHCRERGLGLAPPVVDALLGPETARARRRDRARRARRDALRVAAAVAIAALLCLLGLAVASDPDGERDLYGRTGPVHTR